MFSASRLKIPLALLVLVFGSTIESKVPYREVEELRDEEFHEGLLLRPLPDRNVLAHFHFQSIASSPQSDARHHHLFPKAISQLARKFRVKELELSFTQGRWNYESWGGFESISSGNAKPTGVEMWASFGVPEEEVDAAWRNLTHGLSGLFCASINFLESSAMYSSPHWGFGRSSGRLRYGVLPREAVCTENLTPWLKLLPCRGEAGLSSLLNRASIYRGFYHSQRLHLSSYDSLLMLNQSLTLVLHTGGDARSPSAWSLSSTLGRKITGKCALAGSSYAYIQLERRRNEEGSFELIAKPENILEGDHLHVEGYSHIFEYDVGNYNETHPLDMGLRWKPPLMWNSKLAPLRASRFLTGSGNERGAIALLLEPEENLNRSFDCSMSVEIFQMVPWYVRVYYHTLRLYVDGRPTGMEGVLEKIHVSPSVDKASPGVMEMILRLPCHMKSAVLTLDFDKGFLHIDEYPPDANQGFDIPSAIVRLPDFESDFVIHGVGNSHKSCVLSNLQKRSSVMLYTEVLLVPLTTPDFSMPYNVITITCTVFALYFGSLLNVLRRRDEEEKRVLQRKAATGTLPRLISNVIAKITRGKLKQTPASVDAKLVIKITLVALLAVVWKFYHE